MKLKKSGLKLVAVALFIVGLMFIMGINLVYALDFTDAVKYERSEGGYVADWYIQGTERIISQGFKVGDTGPNTNFNITGVSLLVLTDGGAPGICIVNITTANETFGPQAQITANISWNASSIPAGQTWYNITIPAKVLSAGTRYNLILSCDNRAFVTWRMGVETGFWIPTSLYGNGYEGNWTYYYATWKLADFGDMNFMVWGYPVGYAPGSGYIDNCTSYTNVILNYSHKDEETQNIISTGVATTNVSTYIDANVLLYLTTSGELVANYSSSFTNTTNLKICMNESTAVGSGYFNDTYRLYSQIKYYATNYVKRYNYIENMNVTTSSFPQSINLLDLNLSKATQFLLTYKDKSFLALEAALINIQKQYVGEALFKTVEMEKTDYLGQAVGYFDLSGNNKYTIFVYKNGELLSTFNNIVPYCENAVVGECKINLNAGSTITPNIDFFTYQNLNYYDTLNSSNRTYSFVFTTLDLSVVNITMNLTKFDSYHNTTVCYNSLLSQSGSVTCVIPTTYGNTTFAAIFYKNGEVIKAVIFSIQIGGKDIFSGNVVVILMLLVLSFATMFIPSAIGVVIGTIIGLIAAISMGIITGSFIISGGLIFLVVAGAIIIWRLRQGGSD